MRTVLEEIGEVDDSELDSLTDVHISDDGEEMFKFQAGSPIRLGCERVGSDMGRSG
jgi:hypothetical protein